MPRTGDIPNTPSRLRRRWLLNAVLLVLIGGLAWVAVYRSGQEKAVAGPPLTSLSAAAVTRIRIERPDQPAIALEKKSDEWKLTAPVATRANPFNVDTLMRVLAAPTDTRLPAATVQLANFGLEKPRARVWFDNDEIDFGSLHPLKNQIYVLYKNEVVLIPGYHLAAATYPYTNFIDSRLFEENRQFTMLKLPGFTLDLKNGIWHRQPPDKKLTSDQINDFVSEWQNARALSVDKYSGKAALDKIEFTSVRDGKEEKLRLAILAYKPEFILHREDENLEYHLTEETGKRLLHLSGEP
jgi:Domain of unknown function (DUF4340)